MCMYLDEREGGCAVVSYCTTLACPLAEAHHSALLPYLSTASRPYTSTNTSHITTRVKKLHYRDTRNSHL